MKPKLITPPLKKSCWQSYSPSKIQVIIDRKQVTLDNSTTVDDTLVAALHEYLATAEIPAEPSATPWYADYVNYIIKLYDDVFLKASNGRFWSNATHYPMEDTLEVTGQHQKCYNPDYIGHTSTEMPMHSTRSVIDAKELAACPKETRCLYKTYLKLNYSTLVYGKACHLPVEIEHKAYWVVKTINMDWEAAGQKRLLDLNALEKVRASAYDNAKIYKERTKRWHDRRILPSQYLPG
ncbi:hypothetical protein V6N13_048555 [Hibiscus sabdariffa]|uniref:Uncharacterized protein n=1 Tax=Hibiscus sabdariffa TaxID=183260 RepID=A0ABR2F7J1_9ROSI